MQTMTSGGSRFAAMTGGSRAAVATAAAGALAALAYGTLKAIWALGGTLGVNGTPPWVSDMPGWQHFLGFWGTVILAAVAAAILVVSSCRRCGGRAGCARSPGSARP